MNHKMFSPTFISPSIAVRAKNTAAALILVAVAFLGVSSVAPKAEAAGIAGVTCTITSVWYDQVSGGRLMVFCNGDGSNSLAYQGLLTDANCATKNIDTIKVWTSMSTAYQLAGHKVFIEYNDPANTTCALRTINNIRSF